MQVSCRNPFAHYLQWDFECSEVDVPPVILEESNTVHRLVGWLVGWFTKNEVSF